MVLTAQEFLDKAEPVPLEGFMEFYRFRFMALGTRNDVILHAASRARAQDYQRAVLDWLRSYEARHSVFISDSLVSFINAAAGESWVDIPPETEALFRLCDWYVWRSQGLVDPTAGPLLALWDFRQPHPELPTGEQIGDALALVGWGDVKREPGRVFLPRRGMKIDFGGVGKEYAVDRLIQMATEHGIRDVLVDLGHDIRVMGRAPGGDAWRVGLEHPGSPGQCWGEVALRDAALCCSGNYARFFMHGGRRYGHLVNPRTGRPSDSGCDAAWVMASTAVEAGVLSMMAVMQGADEGLRGIQQTVEGAGCLWINGKCHQTGRFHVNIRESAVHVA